MGSEVGVVVSLDDLVESGFGPIWMSLLTGWFGKGRLNPLWRNKC